MIRRNTRCVARVVVSVSMAVMIFSASPAAAEWDGLPWESLDAGVPRIVFDIAVLRPLGLVQSVVGVAAYVIFYPVSLLTGGSDDVTRACITGPFDQTFRRPLGD
jgi:hypothetical protein